MLIHGVAGTAELNWGKVLVPLGRDFRVVAADLRGHGDGMRLRSRFRLEDCADDIAALAGVLDIGSFAAVGYSMGGLVAQLLYRRHAALVSGLVLCCTAGNARGSPAEQLAALAMPAVAAALRWNPLLQAPHEWSVQHPGVQVHAHQPRGGPLAAARGHPGAGTELGHDVPQRARGLQDVMDGAEQGGIRGHGDLRILGR